MDRLKEIEARLQCGTYTGEGSGAKGGVRLDMAYDDMRYLLDEVLRLRDALEYFATDGYAGKRAREALGGSHE